MPISVRTSQVCRNYRRGRWIGKLLSFPKKNWWYHLADWKWKEVQLQQLHTLGEPCQRMLWIRKVSVGLEGKGASLQEENLLSNIKVPFKRNLFFPSKPKCVTAGSPWAGTAPQASFPGDFWDPSRAETPSIPPVPGGHQGEPCHEQPGIVSPRPCQIHLEFHFHLSCCSLDILTLLWQRHHLYFSFSMLYTLCIVCFFLILCPG